MPPSGSLLVRVFVSRAQLPIPDATVVLFTTDRNGRHHILATRITDDSGLAGPFQLPSSSGGAGLSPDTPLPTSEYNLIVEHPDYQLALFQDLQVYPGIETTQDVPLLPLPVSTSANAAQQQGG